MLFKRREKVNFWKGVIESFWPRRSFWRSTKYFTKRTLRLSGSPHAIAAGIAAGVFASFLPFIGFHLVTAALVAWCVRGNLIASALGTAVGNPFTFPFIWAATLGLGQFVLYGRDPEGLVPVQLGSALSELDIGSLWEPLLKPMTAGGIPLGAVFGLMFYCVTRWATATFREHRRNRLIEKNAGTSSSALT